METAVDKMGSGNFRIWDVFFVTDLSFSLNTFLFCKQRSVFCRMEHMISSSSQETIRGYAVSSSCTPNGSNRGVDPTDPGALYSCDIPELAVMFRFIRLMKELVLPFGDSLLGGRVVVVVF